MNIFATLLVFFAAFESVLGSSVVFSSFPDEELVASYGVTFAFDDSELTGIESAVDKAKTESVVEFDKLAVILNRRNLRSAVEGDQSHRALPTCHLCNTHTLCAPTPYPQCYTIFHWCWACHHRDLEVAGEETDNSDRDVAQVRQLTLDHDKCDEAIKIFKNKVLQNVAASQRDSTSKMLDSNAEYKCFEHISPVSSTNLSIDKTAIPRVSLALPSVSTSKDELLLVRTDFP